MGSKNVLGQPIRQGTILLGSKFNTSYASAAPDIFATALTPPDTPCLCRINVTHSASGILTLKRTSTAATGTMEEILSTLTASSISSVDFIVNSGESINFTISNAGTIMSFNVVEL